MADNTKIGPIFRGANGGLSDDLFTGIRNSFYFSNDMEIRQDAKSAYPIGVPSYASDNGVNLGTANGDSIIYNVTFSSHDGGWIVCCRNNIYKVTNSGVKTLLCTMNEEICDLEIFNGYIYISTRGYLYYKIDDGDFWGNMASATDAEQTYYGRCEDVLSDNANHPLYSSEGILCVGNENKLCKVTKETYNLLQDWIELPQGWYIRFITELGGYIRAIAVDEPYGSEVLLCDKSGAENYPQEIIPLEGYSVLGAAIYNGYLYLLSNKGLGLLNGYQYYLLKKSEGDIDTNVRNCMCVYDDKLYFIANNGVYIYGAKNKNYADVLSLWHKVEDGYKLGAIGSYKRGVMVSRNRGYFGETYYPSKVGINSGLATTGELQTMCYFGTSMSEIKQSMYLRVGYHLGREGTNSGNIHIYYRTEADATTDNPEDWKWHPVTKHDGLYADRDMRCPFATTLKLNCRFQWIQFKFILTNCVYDDNGTTKTKDTNLYSADLYYNVMLD